MPVYALLALTYLRELDLINTAPCTNYNGFLSATFQVIDLLYRSRASRTAKEQDELKLIIEDLVWEYEGL